MFKKETLQSKTNTIFRLKKKNQYNIALKLGLSWFAKVEEQCSWAEYEKSGKRKGFVNPQELLILWSLEIRLIGFKRPI